jgi:hypothetical protein
MENNKLMVVTSKYVMIDKMPILEVYHDDDEEGGSYWQFHCGNGDYSMENMLLVTMQSIINLDSSLKELLVYPVGTVAKRETVNSKWEIEYS